MNVPASDARGASFAESEHERFTDWLRARTDGRWTAATRHRFTEELAAGTLDVDVIRQYLLQDYVFLREATALVAYAAGDAPDVEARGESPSSWRCSAATRTTTFSGPSKRWRSPSPSGPPPS